MAITCISEILRTASSMKDKKKKIEFLQKNNQKAIKTVLKAMYDPGLESLLPEGEPSYNPAEDAEAEGILYKQSKQIPYFFKGTGHDAMKQVYRENIFIRLLESVDPKDAKLLIAMKDKKQYSGLTIEILNSAYPNLIPEKSN